MTPFSITYELFTRHRSAVVALLDALEQAGVERLIRASPVHIPTAMILFIDSDTPLEELQDVLTTWQSVGSTQLIAITLDQLPLLTGWSLLKKGVREVFTSGATADLTATLLSRFQHWRQLDEQVRQLQKTLIGNSPLWVNTLLQLAELAQSDCPVLILGESGTGKELVARQIHQLDGRPDKRDYVVVDSTNLMPGLAGSELFGHEKGAFTHAISQREGAVAQAHGGTLFLDELGELPLTQQAELLRVLQEGTYKRVGSDVWRHARFRLISATNRDLTNEIVQGRFRADLYYRISGWVCQLPSLRQRRDDIPLIAEYLFRHRFGCRQPIDPQVYDFLMLKEYPGNIRELQQLVHRIASRHVGDGPITICAIPQADWPDFLKTTDESPLPVELTHGIKRLVYQGVGLKEMKDIVTDIAKKEAIGYEQGNLRLAALRLGCSERILQMHRKEEYEQ